MRISVESNTKVANQHTDFRSNFRPARPWLTLPFPKKSPTGPVPSNDGIWLDDGQVAWHFVAKFRVNGEGQCFQNQ